MSSKGWVTTARGDSLNIDDLIAKSKRPIGVKEAKSEIKKKSPPKRRPLNIRGNMPVQGSSAVPEMPEEVAKAVNQMKAPVEAPAQISAYRKGEEATSLADMTGVRVEKKATTKKPEESAIEAANGTLGNILGDLEEKHPNSFKAAEEVEAEENAPKRSTRKKT